MPFLQATTLEQQFIGKKLDVEYSPALAVLFRYVVLVSSVWKNVGMTINF